MSFKKLIIVTAAIVLAGMTAFAGNKPKDSKTHISS